MKKILIIDTKAGNLFSLKSAIKRLALDPIVLQQPNDEKFDAVVVPGQGRFGTVLKNLAADGWIDYLNSLKGTSIPILGICVGMQIFFDRSEEDVGIKGLSWLKGKAKALNFPKKPMVGWANLTSQVWVDSCVYFVNSFAIQDSDYSIANCTYGETFCAAVHFENFVGVQFHPEKSSVDGAKIIEQVLIGLEPRFEPLVWKKQA
ncbi:MAG: imidazole glycerol phosphate synthase subunit HisH [Kangiellaceae bacterium]|nr:imidazole glycerol phosphate synthase subunit HisH [Kangiellaceae bacterium]